ncbi:acyl-CoA dehydrogenase family protein [Nocardia sp. CA-107356]|uniref:acyl-CoA dehydrogenase family protein n=1 Tax=Nocardia sp. CA-107356 TaxID=3239972 RepID=UPI003D948A61
MASSALDLNSSPAALRARLLGLVDDIRETLAGCVDEAEAAGFYPERGWRAMQDSGLLAMKAPLELGGFEADPLTQLDVFEEVASIDGSTGWTYVIGVGSLAVLTGWLQKSAVEDFMVDGRLPRTAFVANPSGRAVPADGGFRVTGRWQFGSGSAHAERIAGMCIVDGEDRPRVLACLFNLDDVTLHDNWNVNGLRGTGSQDYSVNDLFVPTRHTLDYSAPATHGGAMYRIGLPGFSMMEHGGWALGVARSALAQGTELMKTKARGTQKPQRIATRGKFQFDLGRCETNLAAARNHLRAVTQTVWEAAQDDELKDHRLQIELRCAAIHATEVAREICETIFRYGGAKSLYAGNPLERCQRDAIAGAQHGLMNDSTYEELGKASLGFEDTSARI